ncbi:MAG: hypothetical protein J1E60_00355 [Christensenellaceae bacterium]|nr:hypothetical protein [Christensenellaceae bacterium]
MEDYSSVSVFENRFKETKRVKRQMYGKLRPIDDIIIGFLCGVILYESISMLYYGYITLALLFLSLCILYALHMFVFRSMLIARREAKRDLVIYNAKDPEKWIYYTEDCIIFVNQYNGGIEKFKYEQIRKLSETKDLFKIWLPQNLFLVAHKGGFVKGTPLEFIEFIKRKAPKAKIKLKDSSNWYS